MKRRFFPTLLLLIFLAATGALIYLVQDEIRKELSIRDMESELDGYFVSAEPPASNTEEQDGGLDETLIPFDWASVLADGEDVVGWIQMEENPKVDYPIVQADDNSWYLNHDWKGRKQFAGAIFMNAGNSEGFTDPNTIIYGHRMKNRSMFGSFKYYTDQSYLDEHHVFYIYMPDGTRRTYEIFVCSNVIDGSDTYTAWFQTAKERLSYYDDLYRQSISERSADLDEYDTTVTLSTCAARGYYNRIVICGKLVAIEQNKYPINYEE